MHTCDLPLFRGSPVIGARALRQAASPALSNVLTWNGSLSPWRRAVLLFCLIAGLCAPQGAFASYLYVWQSSPSDGPGTAWNNAFHTIQGGINAAADGDTVVVQNDTYSVTTPLNVNKGITLAGAAGNTTATIVDGNNVSRCLIVAHTNAVIASFTFRRGYHVSAGGGVYFSVAGGQVYNSHIRECHAEYGGGVMFAATGGMLDRCSVYSNYADLGTERQGGGVYMQTGTTVRNCLIYGNTARLGGGVITYGHGLIQGCTVCDNHATFQGGGLYTLSYGTYVNTILYFNTAASEGSNHYSFFSPTMATFTACCVTPDPGGAGTITDDPQFENRPGLNYTLKHYSPCINAGSNAGAGGANDLLGHPRILNGTVDIGCYEFWFSAAAVDVTNASQTVSWTTASFAVSGTNNAWTVGSLVASNAANGAAASFAAASPWTAPALALAMGANVLSVAGTNRLGEVASDSVTVTRESPAVTYVSPGGGHVAPYGSWQTAATNIQPAVDAVAAGGAVWVSNGTYAVTAPVTVSKALTLRSVSGAAATLVDGGGAARCLTVADAGAVVSGFTFQNGDASGDVGGGVTFSVAGGEVRECLIAGCRADYGGGVFFAAAGGLLDRCVVTGCRAGAQGGGVYLRDGAIVRNCLLYGNRADEGGGVLSYQGGLVQDCTVCDNEALAKGGGAFAYEGGSYVTTVLYFNSALSGGANWYVRTSGEFGYCCLTPDPGGKANITGDPAFVDRRAADYRLLDLSPCRDTGRNDLSGGAGDLDGLPRILNGTVDIGCHEYLGAPSVTITTPDQSVPWDTLSLAVSGTCNAWAAGTLIAVNAANAASATFAAAAAWTAPALPLAMGANVISVSGTNVAGAAASDSVTITRLAPDVTYVAPGGTHVAPFGSWQTAATNIQAAVDAVASNGTVWVTNGTYAVTAPVTLNAAVTLRSVNGSAATVVDGGGTSRCLIINHAGAVVAGFTFARGYDPGAGGGIHFSAAGGLVRECRVTGCRADYGAGVMFAAEGGMLDRCEVVSNRADVAAQNQGGGVYLRFGATVRNCLVYANSARIGGGILSYSGGLVQGCTVSANSATGAGGGVFFYGGGDYRNCIIYFNTAPDGPNYYSSGSIAYCCTTPDPGGAGNIASDPLFANPAGGDCRLAAASPCLDSGSNADAGGTLDLGGLPRILYGTVDRGCYETIGAPYIDITTPATNVAWDVTAFAVTGTNTQWITGRLWVSNALNGASASFAAVSPWTAPALALAMGANVFTVSGTNELGEAVSDSVTVTRLPPAVTYVSPGGKHKVPFGTWADAATNIQAAVDAAATNGTVWVTNGTYVVTAPVTVEKALTLQSVGGKASTVVDGNSASRCLVVNHTEVEVSGFTFLRGYNADVGGGALVLTTGCAIRACRIERCRARYGAGVMFVANGGLLEASEIVSNAADVGDFPNGGGVYLRDGVTVRNCLITGNSSQYGGGVFAYYGGLVQGSTICDNSASGNGGGIDLYYGGTLRNCIIYFNTAGGGPNYTGSGSIASCCTTPDPGGTGNITADPLFADRPGGDYRLVATSPCFNSGSNADAGGSADLAGRPRIMGGRVDMGCYELSGAPFVDITTPAGSVAGDVAAYAVSGTNNLWVTGLMTVSNAANGAWAAFAAATPWSAPALTLAMGTNTFTVTGTNALGAAATDTVKITRLPPTVTYVSPAGGHVAPYFRWQDAATNIQSAVDAVAGGGTVWVTNGTYAVTAPVSLAKAVTLRGLNGAAGTIITGGGTARCLELSHTNAAVQGLTLRNGYSGATGGGIYVGVAGGVIRGCRVTECRAEYGAGVFFAASGGLLETSWLVSNRADVASQRQGGGVYIRAGVTVRNCLATHNSAVYGGGILSYQGGSVSGCTFSDNSASTQGGGIYAFSGGAYLNCISYYNTAGGGANIFINGGGTFTYCCATPAPAGTGNIASAPLFVSPGAPAFNYRLQYGSLCIDTGTESGLAEDLDGNARPLDGNGDTVALHDRGAYEYNPLTADSNMDAIPDWWCLRYGLSPVLAGVAQGNPDGDAFTTGDEWTADTDPTNNASFFRITAIDSGAPTEVWVNSSTARVYTLQWREALSSGGWQDLTGQTLLPGNGGPLTLIHNDPPVTSAFYRVRVQLP